MAVALLAVPGAHAGEHGGKEHAGKEHRGSAVKKKSRPAKRSSVKPKSKSKAKAKSKKQNKSDRTPIGPVIE